MKTFFQIFKNAWSYITCSVTSLIKDTVKDVKEIISNIWKYRFNIVILCMYLIPMSIAIYYFNIWCVIILGIYLFIGTFFAMFNDAGPLWFSYVAVDFWLPIILVYKLIINPVCWIIMKFNLIKPRYTEEEIEASNYFYQVGKELIDKNKDEDENEDEDE